MWECFKCRCVGSHTRSFVAIGHTELWLGRIMRSKGVLASRQHA